jgi:copper chaperone
MGSSHAVLSLKRICSRLIFKQDEAMNHLFTVQGMTCGHCEKAVTKALISIDPQAKVIIDRTQDAVTVDSEQPRETLRQAITDEGYKVQA